MRFPELQEEQDQDQDSALQGNEHLAFAFVNVDRDVSTEGDFQQNTALTEEDGDCAEEEVTFNDSALLQYYRDLPGNSHYDQYVCQQRALPYKFSILNGIIKKIPVFVERGVQTDCSLSGPNQVFVEIKQYKTLARSVDDSAINQKVRTLAEGERTLNKGTCKFAHSDLDEMPGKGKAGVHHCKLCLKSFPTRARMALHHCSSSHSCGLCNKSYRSDLLLQIHMRSHDGYMLYTCKTCNKSFSKTQNFEEHLKIHPNSKPFWCAECNVTYKTIHPLRMHHARAHRIEPMDDAVEGRDSFEHEAEDSVEMETRRISSEIESDFRCKYCSKLFSNEHNLTRHKCSSVFNCSICGTTCNSIFFLRMHQKKHDGMMVYPCKTCKKSFKSNDEFHSHLAIHPNPKPYCCNICDKSYEEQFNLLWHVTSVHSDHDLDDVPNITSSSGGLDSNEGNDKGDSPTLTTSSSLSNNKDDDDYICKCGKTFALKSALVLHKELCPAAHSSNKISKESDMNSLTTDLPCELCEETFKSNTQLQLHMKYHLLGRNNKDIEQSSKREADTYTNETEEDDIDDDYEPEFNIEEQGNFDDGTESSTGEPERESQDENRKKLECKLCGKSFTSGRHLGGHMSAHRFKSFEVTSEDTEVGRKNKDVRDTVQPVSPEKHWFCEFCRKPFTSNLALREHLAHHVPTKESSAGVAVCDDDSGIPTHEVVEGVNKCRICRKGFKSRRQLERHMKLHSKPLSLKVRRRLENKRKTLKKVKLLQRQRYICRTCGKDFAKINNLASHLKVHGKDKKITEKDYQDSVIDETGEEESPSVGNVGASFVKNVIKCQVCQFKFSSEDDCKQHEVEHKSNPYGCNTCGQMFKTKRSADHHKLTHSSNVVFPCEMCGKVFTRKPSLYMHTVRNHNRKPTRKVLSSGAAAARKLLSKAKLIEKKPAPSRGSDVDVKQKDPLYASGKEDTFEGSKENFSRTQQAKVFDRFTIVKDPDGRFVCQLCEAVFTAKSSVQRHWATNHTVRLERYVKVADSVYYCKNCRKHFTDFKNFSFHVKKVHHKTVTDELSTLLKSNEPAINYTGEEPLGEGCVYRCENCPLKFLTVKELEEHTKVHDVMSPPMFAQNVSSTTLESYLNEGSMIGESKSTDLSEYKSLDTKHVCCLCDKSFEQNHDLAEHMKVHGIKNYNSWKARQIRLLKSSARSTSSRSNSIESESGKDATINTAASTKSADGIAAVEETEDKQHVCSECKTVFETSQKLEKHLKEHEGLHICEICNRGFRNTAYLKEHTVAVHGETKSFPCDVCGRNFNSSQLYLMHLKRDHNSGSSDEKQDTGFDENPAEWEVSDAKSEEVDVKQLRSESNREPGDEKIGKHILNEGGTELTKLEQRSFSCEFCGKVFSRPRSLKEHRHLHTEKKAYLCEVCGKSFRMQSSRYVHMKQVHKRRPVNYNTLRSTKLGSLVRAQKMHVKRETAENQTSDLKSPVEVRQKKDGGKFHYCNLCGKELSIQTNIRRHINAVHRNIKDPRRGRPNEPKAGKAARRKVQSPYECDICKKGFFLKSKLTRHKYHYHPGWKSKQRVTTSSTDQLLISTDQGENISAQGNEGATLNVETCDNEYESGASESKINQIRNEPSVITIVGAEQLESGDAVSYIVNDDSMQQFIPQNQVILYQPNSQDVSYIAGENVGEILTDDANETSDPVPVESDTPVYQEYVATVTGNAEDDNSKDSTSKDRNGTSIGSSRFLVSETETYSQVAGNILWPEQMVGGRESTDSIIITSDEPQGIVISQELVLTNDATEAHNNS